MTGQPNYEANDTTTGIEARRGLLHRALWGMYGAVKLTIEVQEVQRHEPQPQIWNSTNTRPTPELYFLSAQQRAAVHAQRMIAHQTDMSAPMEVPPSNDVDVRDDQNYEHLT